jgi:hypothetical protein
MGSRQHANAQVQAAIYHFTSTAGDAPLEAPAGLVPRRAAAVGRPSDETSHSGLGADTTPLVQSVPILDAWG